ncbi:hypothetical protein ALQ18_00312 [Pseudomonas marginalis pv. marginalis]|nr:hypothetical protein ALQ18_00312 [Pseudomonas marginalis pv. marginalis]
MLVNNNTQAVSTIEKLKRSDMDPANAAASTLYSGAVQAAQQSITVPTAQKDLNKASDRIDEAFAKTRVQLQATTAATTATTDVPATGSTTSTARTDFSDYMKLSPAERIREQLLKEQGLTEVQVQAMPQEKQDAIAKQVADRVKQQQEQQVAAKTADPQAQALKETLAAL